MRGIRARLTAVATMVVVVVLVLTVWGLTVSQRDHLVGALDEDLSVSAQEILDETAQDGSSPTESLTPPGDDDSVGQLVEDGRVVSATSNFEGREPLPPPPGGATESARTVALVDGEPSYRVITRRSGDRVVHVAAPLDDIDDGLSALLVRLVVIIPCVSALLALAVWGLVGRALRPVEEIRREVDDIGGSDLHRRVPEPGGDDEIARLAVTMNRMLDRIELSVEHQRRFVDDASHELRGPLTRMRAELEVDAGHPETADLAVTHATVLTDVVAMQHLVDDLLLLAREDAVGAGRRVPVDLDDLVWEEVRRRREEGDTMIDGSAVSAAQVEGDPSQLTRVVVNLLDNAQRHARSRVRVEVHESGGRAVLVVADDGGGIDPADRERVFERFARLDDARSADTGGTGLGLAIVAEIVARHGGTVRVDSDGATGARFVVELPRVGTPSTTG